MTGWDPREEMGLLTYYFEFKMGQWVQVDTVPDWVLNAHEGYWPGFVEKYGHKPYNQEKIYNGDSLQYRVFHNETGGDIRTEYYVRIKQD
jgi:hypothetical protein